METGLRSLKNSLVLRQETFCEDFLCTIVVALKKLFWTRLWMQTKKTPSKPSESVLRLIYKPLLALAAISWSEVSQLLVNNPKRDRISQSGMSTYFAPKEPTMCTSQWVVRQLSLSIYRSIRFLIIVMCHLPANSANKHGSMLINRDITYLRAAALYSFVCRISSTPFGPRGGAGCRTGRGGRIWGST